MNLLAILFLIVGLFSLGYCFIIISYSGITTAFLWFWMVLGFGSLVLTGLLIFMHKQRIAPGKPLRIGFITILILGITVFALVEGFIIHAGSKKPEPGADYVIVLGAQVRGRILSRALKNRLDTALKYLNENNEAKVIVSGGQGSGEDISEAEAMSEYLEAKGIQKSRIIMEDQSTNTFENIKFSKENMVEGEYHIVLVTNGFHVLRAVSIAKKQNIGDIQGLGAPNDDCLTLHYYVREFFAIIKEKLVGNI